MKKLEDTMVIDERVRIKGNNPIIQPQIQDNIHQQNIPRKGKASRAELERFAKQQVDDVMVRHQKVICTNVVKL